METFQEHYLSMKRTIAARKLNVDMALIDRAVDYAREKHKDQKRKDGSPYIIHPLAVAEIVAEIGSIRMRSSARCCTTASRTRTRPTMISPAISARRSPRLSRASQS